MELVIVFLVGVIVYAACLWSSAKITGVEASGVAILSISFISSAAGMIPGFGLILGTVVLLVLICVWTSAELWPDAVLMVVVARVLAVAISLLVLGALGGGGEAVEVELPADFELEP